MTTATSEKTWRFAVATTDGTNIDTHLGRAEGFVIYDLDPEGEIRLIERRSSEAWSRLNPHLPASIDQLLFGIDVVLASQAGPTAIQALGARGIRCYTAEGPVERALKRFAKHGARLRTLPIPGVSGCGGCSGGACC